MLKLRYAEDCKSAPGNSVLRRIANFLFARNYIIAATDIFASCFAVPIRAQHLRLATCPAVRRGTRGRLR